MNSEHTETQAPAPSLRDVLALKGIESSYDLQQKRARERLGRMFVSELEREAIIPGIEVAYHELDPQLWDQLAFAS
jgi:hypothetical protein